MPVKRRKKISFWATNRAPKKVRVTFSTKRGKRVSFNATKRVPRKVKVTFYARRRKADK